MKIQSSHLTSCSARFLCRVDALAPAAPTSRSSQSNWQSSWRESLSAGGRTGFLSPLRCRDPTARLWSSFVSPDWPAIHTQQQSRNHLQGNRIAFPLTLKIRTVRRCRCAQKRVSHLYETFRGLQVQEGCCWSIIMLLCEWRQTVRLT